MSNLKSNKFTVKIKDKEVDLYFKRPTHSELFEIDLIYRKVYSEALRAGVITDAEAGKTYKKTNAWTEEDEKQITNYTTQIVMEERKLEDEKKTKKEKEKVIDNLIELRRKLMELITTKTQLFNNTAEGLASEQKMHKFIQLCCWTEDDEKFFESEEHYQNFVSEHTDELADMK
jgi:hypothetical protein